MAKASRLISITTVLALCGACSVHQSSTPTLAGPSGLATSVTITATPDHITQDGASQSAVQVLVVGPDGRGMSGVSLRVDMTVNGVLADYGTLSARTIVSGSDGKATTVYTAPPAPPANLNSGTTFVGIRAIPLGTDAAGSNGAIAYVDLVPPGVILPPAGTPSPAFTITPSPVGVGIASVFDASTSTPGSGASQITSYTWDFGDGGTGSGKAASHTFTSAATFNVTLTVTNDRLLSASTTKAVSVTANPPSPHFTVSPSAPQVNQQVVVDASTSTTAAGVTIASYEWNFGDGTPNMTCPGGAQCGSSGRTASHVYSAAGTYNINLTVTDSTGQKAATSSTVTVGATTPPVAALTFSPAYVIAGAAITFDAGASTGVIVRYQWDFGDGSAGVQTTFSTIQHTFSTPGTYTVTVTVFDATGNSSSKALAVVVHAS